MGNHIYLYIKRAQKANNNKSRVPNKTWANNNRNELKYRATNMKNNGKGNT